MNRWRLILLLLLVVALLGSGCERLAARRTLPTATDPLDDGADAPGGAPLPPGVKLVRDVAYGRDPQQRFDVYLPAHPNGTVLFMVHGGGWTRGDKAAGTVVTNKVAYFVPQGYIFISTNYRMEPAADPLTQAADVAAALAKAQGMAGTWDGDAKRFVLLGHSAGAHLVALLASAPAIATQAKAGPWLGTVALDSAALDVVQIMQGRHLPLYDQPFGTDPAYWREASPYHQLAQRPAPVLAVCSTRRLDSCAQAERFVTKAKALGGRASVLREDLSHREINDRLGLDEAYTKAVAAFLQTL